jgi:hypothetical protein
MKPLTPEFIAPRRPHRLLWWAPGLLAGAALAAWALGWREQAEVQDLRQQVNAARDAALALASPAAPATPQPPPAYADSAREFLAEQAAGWAATLLALERTALLGVTPIAIEVQSRERSARIEVEFADYAVLMRYLEQLNAGAGVAEWSLVSAQRSGAVGAGVPAGAAGTGTSTAVLMRRW